MRTRKPIQTVVVLVGIAKLAVCPALADSFTGNLNLSTQAEIDAASIYTSVTGSVTVSGADIHNLSPLAGITTIGSYLTIRNNPALVSVVDAFPALTGLGGGGISLFNNENLTSFRGFNALVETGDTIEFYNNDSLVTISGFDALQTAGWSLEFIGNPALEQIPSFDSLQTISSSLFILDNPSLTGITGFGALQHVDWSFQIIGNNRLADLCGFFHYFSANNPYTGGGAFDIKDNDPSLPNPTTIQDVLDGGGCFTLLRLSAFTYDPATGESEVSIRGAAATSYKLVEAADLDFATPDQATVPLSGASVGTLNGDVVTADIHGDATVQFNLGTGKEKTFIRAEHP